MLIPGYLDRKLKPSLISQPAKDLFKYLGAGKVESIEVKEIGKQPGSVITPEMKSKIESEGRPLFSKAGKRNNDGAQSSFDFGKLDLDYGNIEQRQGTTD